MNIPKSETPKRVVIYSNYTVSIDGKHIGGIKCISKYGNTQNPTGSTPQDSMDTIIYSLRHDPITLEMPVYADGLPNELLADAYWSAIHALDTSEHSHIQNNDK